MLLELIVDDIDFRDEEASNGPISHARFLIGIHQI